jgi:integrase
MTTEQVARLIQVARQAGPREYAIIILMSHHFIRASELTQMKVSDANLADQTVSITRLKGSVSKVESMMPGDAEALQAWLKVKPVSPFLFPGRAGRMTRQQVYNIYRGLAEQAALPATSRAPHSARHTIGQRMAEAGLQAKEIQQAAGHKNLNSTGQYFEYRQSHIDAQKAKALGLMEAA